MVDRPIAPVIRSAAPKDADAVHALVMELAEYEQMADDVVSTPEMIGSSLRAGDAEALVAEVSGVCVGFALYFQNYSTFLGRSGLYLEDLYVQPTFRGSGIGRALLLEVAQVAKRRGCERMDWSVLDWNAPAIAFYEALGAKIHRQWLLVRLDRASLEALPSADANA